MPSAFSEICNGNTLSVAKYQVAFRTLTVIRYDSVVLRLTTETRKRIFKRFLKAPQKKPKVKSKLTGMIVNYIKFMA